MIGVQVIPCRQHIKNILKKKKRLKWKKIKKYFTHSDIKTKFKRFEKRCIVNFMKNKRRTKKV